MKETVVCPKHWVISGRISIVAEEYFNNFQFTLFTKLLYQFILLTLLYLIIFTCPYWKFNYVTYVLEMSKIVRKRYNEIHDI